MKFCGESGEVSGETVTSWNERLPEIVGKYSTDDIWNMDETGVFWQALPDSGFGQRGKQCHGGKQSKRRITIAFFVSASGKTELKPIVSENPRCLKRFNKAALPVTYFSQMKAWMTGEILDTILTKLNRQLSSKNRHILLLMDNAGCHPQELEDKYSNIVSKIDQCCNASEVVKSINILVAIRWSAIAWSKVKEETVRKCFRNAGILNQKF